MNVITITREYGAGGGEVARKLADSLGWELLDRELLHQAAEVEHVPDAELERLDEKTISMSDRFRLHPPHQKYLHGLKAVVQKAAERGRVVLIGRGARHLLGEPKTGAPDALHLRLVAPRAWRAARMSQLNGWSTEQALAKCVETDRVRERFTRYFFGDRATQAAEYDLIYNSGRLPLDDAATVAERIVRGVGGADSSPDAGDTPRRVLTVSRELGAGEQGLPAALGQRLQMQVCDRELLEQEAVRLGVSKADLEKIDERGAGIFQRFRPGSLYQRYFEALGQIMRDSSERGNVVLVGRGGSRFLRDDPRAFHVRFVAPMSVRIRRVMEHRWVQESVARKLIAESDARRNHFYESYFGADWSSPLEYDLTANSGRLGLAALDAAAVAGELHWQRQNADDNLKEPP